MERSIAFCQLRRTLYYNELDEKFMVKTIDSNSSQFVTNCNYRSGLEKNNQFLLEFIL